MDREAQDLGREAGCVGEGVQAITPLSRHRLVVDRARVVDGGKDGLLAEALNHSVSELRWEPDGVLVVDVSRALLAGERPDLVSVGEALVIDRCEGCAPIVPSL